MTLNLENPLEDLEQRADTILDGLKNIDDAFHYDFTYVREQKKKYVTEKLLALVIDVMHIQKPDGG